jgi:hypothetical protein
MWLKLALSKGSHRAGVSLPSPEDGNRAVKFQKRCGFSYFRVLKNGQDRLCGLVVGVLGYRSGGPGSIPGTTRKTNVVGLERGPLSLVTTTEELLDRKVAAPI